MIFHDAFRDFEKWHIQQRRAVTVAKREHSIRELFHDLRDPSRDHISAITAETTFTPLAIEADTGLIHLDGTPSEVTPSGWTIDEAPLHVISVENDVIAVDGPTSIGIDSILVQKVVTHEPPALLHALEEFWRGRWYKDTPPTEAEWLRITAFAQASIPSGNFDFAPISTQRWKRQVRHFKPRAARGADGYGKMDLQSLSSEQTEDLLHLLHLIEAGETDWPRQLLEGLVVALAKKDHPVGVGDYRPVVLLSMIYRCWSSIRSQQLMSHLKHIMPEDAYGFLPHKEPAQIWLVLQGMIEHSLATGRCLGGVSSDVAKAFNCIQRQPLFALASHLGAPPGLLQAWSSFLSNFTRRFLVMNCVGAPLLSDVGFPEGCALSVAAMAMLDGAMHIYQQKFTMRTRTMSFVDNITICGPCPTAIAMSYTTLRTFFRLWGLELDYDKTYCWGTDRTTRQGLLPLGFRQVFDASELGGSMSFSAAYRNRLLRQRGTPLSTKWERLRRSASPLALKLVSLPMAFWARALHGASSCPLSAQYIDQQRSHAMKALRLNTAGANPLLRLTLSSPMTSDPGFYILNRAVADFRRICGKSPGLLDLWTSFMSEPPGRFLPGPFSVLLRLFGMIGWSFTVAPKFTDHDQVCHDFLRMDDAAMSLLLQDAWLQMVAAKLKNRKDFSDLCGIDPTLVFMDRSGLTPMELARLMALHEGAFISPWQKSRYDSRQQAICQLCHCPDTVSHWLKCRRYDQQRGDLRILAWAESCPQSFVQHLLPPRSPWIGPFRRALLEYSDEPYFQSLRGTGPQALFVDGSCIHHGPGRIPLAAWSVINATTGDVICSAPLSGITQSIGRAETMAVLAALLWALETKLDIHIYCDSKFLVDQMQRWLIDGLDIQSYKGGNADLVARISLALEQLALNQVHITWIPSHLDPGLCETTEEEWLESWNTAVDNQAVHTNLYGRDSAFRDLLQQMVAFHELWLDRFRTLRRFLLDVAAVQQEAKHTDPDIILVADEDWGQQACHLSLIDQLPLDWTSRVPMVTRGIPRSFVLQLMTFIERCEGASFDFEPVSYIELAMICLGERNFHLPKPHAEDVQTLVPVSSFFTRPTLAHVINLVRGSIRLLVRLFDLEHMVAKAVDRSLAQISFPVDGILIQMPFSLIQGGQARLRAFSGGRGIRKASDLARPIPSG